MSSRPHDDDLTSLVTIRRLDALKPLAYTARAAVAAQVGTLQLKLNEDSCGGESACAQISAARGPAAANDGPGWPPRITPGWRFGLASARRAARASAALCGAIPSPLRLSK